MDYDTPDAVPPPAGGGGRNRPPMDYDTLLDGCCQVGVQIVRCGGEIQRAEDTVRRLLAAYRLEGEVFAVPNCVWVSVRAPDGRVHTVMRRVPSIVTDIDGIERFNDLSRRLCADPPADPAELSARCGAALAELRAYPVVLRLAGYFLGAFFFALFFSGGWAEAAAAGLAGLAGGTVLVLLERARANGFLTTLISAFVLGAAACGLPALGAPINLEVTVAGGLMVLVPGLVFTSFMSDLLTGDMMAGLATFARAVLSAAAIALGTVAAMALFLGSAAPGSHTIPYPEPLYCLFAFLGCLGFCPAMNVRGMGTPLCCLGGAAGWAAYLAVMALGGGSFVASLVGAVVVAVFAEAMARLRKCPATSYSTIALFPLVPGLTIYQAMDHGIRGDTELFWETFFRTFGIAGCIALGLLLVSAVLELQRRWKR